MSRKLFVGGLDFERTTSNSLHTHFSQFGEIVEAIVICDKHSGRSKGYGFVTFVSDESAHNALIEPNPVIDGRKSNVNIAYTNAKKPLPNNHTYQGASSPRSPKPQQSHRHNMSSQSPVQQQFAPAAPPPPYGFQLGYNPYGQYAPGPTLFYPMSAAPGYAAPSPMRTALDSDLVPISPQQQHRQRHLQQHPVMYFLQPSAGYPQQYFVPMSPTMMIEDFRDSGNEEIAIAAAVPMEPTPMIHHSHLAPTTPATTLES